MSAAREPAWVVAGRRYLGQAEVRGPGSNPWIADLWARLRGGAWFWNQYGRDDSRLPWCGAYVARSMDDVGISYPRDYASARAWLGWGLPLHLPLVGAVVVFGRDGGGHVGLVVGQDQRGRLMVLGGNQGDRVSIAPFERDRVLGLRCPPGRIGELTIGVLPVVASDAASSSNEA